MLELNRESFKILYGLKDAQPWLRDKEAALCSLLFEDCPSSDHRTLILDLINRFTYLSVSAYKEKIGDLAMDIATDPEISEGTTQIVAMAADSSADSSQYVLYDLKVELEKKGWSNYKQVNKFGDSYKMYTRNPEHKHIVLIDEFIGSGQTVKSRVDELHRVYRGASVADYTVRVKALVATRVGVEFLRGLGIVVDAQVMVDRGISDYYHGASIAANIRLMKDVESVLSEQFHLDPELSLGYSQVEALYTRDGGNTPNNVFPIFWWARYKMNKARNTICLRSQVYS